MLAIDSVQVIGIYFTVTMEQKDVFYKLLDEHIEKLDGKYKDKFCISQQVYDETKTVLSLDKGEKCDSGSYFKFRRCQNFKFRTTEQSLIENIPGFEFLMDWSF